MIRPAHLLILLAAGGVYAAGAVPLAGQEAAAPPDSPAPPPDPPRSAAERWLERGPQPGRKLDPFGLPMNPEEALPQIEAPPQEKDPVDPGPTLKDALLQFRVTGVHPGRGEFLALGRRLMVGDTVRITARGRRFALKILEVTAREITLQDRESGEIGKVLTGIVNVEPR